ncbi:MAG: hypothetical protein FJX47_01075 [Alphaproteobacteria bacterium]|nr:hypothetical protein [Alphaproteobacteria bacterium]
MSGETKSLGLLLIGHGSSRDPDAGGPTRRLADALKAGGSFGAVEHGFLFGVPKMEEALAGLLARPAGDVVIVPHLADDGVYANETIPRRLNLTGAVTATGGRRLWYTPPLGAHETMVELISRTARRGAAEAGQLPSAVSLILLAHGSRRSEISGATAKAHADRLRARGEFREVVALYLEQEPRAANWEDHVAGETVLVVPVLAGAGRHAQDDVPAIFAKRQGRTIAILPPPGEIEDLARAVLDLARKAVLGSTPTP